MFRLTRAHRFKVSNQLAVLAAFLLIAASIGHIAYTPEEAGPSMVQADTTPAGTSASVNRDKGFKVSLYLFRRN